MQSLLHPTVATRWTISTLDRRCQINETMCYLMISECFFSAQVEEGPEGGCGGQLISGASAIF